ncbi:serine hydrolase domain-containing protein [Phenylobacterium aquaticum]|uniref:serine hydrolase domain-containing protein n=1 Tax=Phenylobacterium aquaticum TaxID=1763816 RepID=UPI001F5DDC4F|nr:serine hydrolase [Phenylobacterium aquaticum]MCI3134778.1 beta-lactamase family protein [Phenylobacterium aquaticum]
MRPIPAALLLAAALPLSACAGLSHAPDVATGLVSHQLCSATFISGQDPDQTYREALAPVLGPFAGLVRHKVDRETGEVTARLGPLSRARAIYRGPLGCLVLRGAPPEPVVLHDAPATAPLLAPIAGPQIVTPQDPTLVAALDHAFAEPGKIRRNIKAVVIVHDGRVIAERYAPGVGPETPLHGWSMTKSATNALLGVLVAQGRLDMTKPAPVAEWADASDPRHVITPDDLLRMRSGLKLGDSSNASTNSAVDISARAMFAERDMAGFSAAAPLDGVPGQSFAYADGETLILSRIIRDLAGGDAAAVHAFMRRELFDKLGMAGAVLELDALGTPLGGSHLYAPARDWAKLGQLYVQDGVVGGERILPAGWVDYSARQTPGSERIGYGAGFWTERGEGWAVNHRRENGLPADSFMARGSFGQFMLVSPANRLVIVQMGPSNSVGGDIEGLFRLTRETLASIGAKP